MKTSLVVALGLMAATVQAQNKPKRLAYVDSLKQPESVVHDVTRDVFYVSNIEGQSLQKDGRGFITKLRADGTKESLRWIDGGRNGVTLHAPKGMALSGDTLWVSDIDAVRGFNVHSGAAVATIDLAPMGAVFLNDVVVGGDGVIYVTDTQLKPDTNGNMVHPTTDRVYRIDKQRKATVALETDRLQRPNGITWDRTGNRFVIVPFGGDTLMSWTPGTSRLTPIAAGPGQFDGVVVSGGRVFVSSKATHTLHELRGDSLVKLMDHAGDVADIEVDAKRSRLFVPLTGQNRVDVYEFMRVAPAKR